MSGPANIAPRREVHDIDHMLASAGGEGWAGLEEKLLPALVGEKFRPDDKVLETLARMWMRPDERAVIEWWFDLTSRAPYPTDHGDMERLGLAAAKHMSRAAVGEAVALGLAEGAKIINQGS